MYTIPTRISRKILHTDNKPSNTIKKPGMHWLSFLASFSLSLTGAVSEAIMYGEAYPVTIYGPGESILRLQRSPIEFYYRAPDEESYVKYVASLARKKEEIRAVARKMRILIKENEQLFGSRLCSLNKQIDLLKHVPGEIPIVKKIESDDCRTLAELDQSDIGDKIDSLFPIMQSIPYHVGMALKGYQSRRVAIQRILRRVKTRLSRIMP